MVRHKQAVAIIDTAPPVRLRFQALSLEQEAEHPAFKGLPDVIDLKDAEESKRVARIAGWPT